MTSRLAKAVNITFLLLGVCLLFGLVLHLDLETVLERLVQVGWYFPLAFLAYTVSNLITTKGWKEMVTPDRSSARYLDFLAAFWAGHAVNALTPGGTLGEVLRGNIMKDKVDVEELVASLMILFFLNTLAVNLFTLVGPLACLVFIDLPTDVLLILFGIALVFFVPVSMMYLFVRLGAAHKLIWLADKIPFVKLKEPDALLAKACNIDKKVRDFRSSRPKAFARAFSYLLLVRLFQVAEIWIILMALLPEHGISWLLLLALLTQTATQLIAWAMVFVPGQMGVAEGGAALLFSWLGMDPITGLSMELVRRLRKILGIAIGLALGMWLGFRKR